MRHPEMYRTDGTQAERELVGGAVGYWKTSEQGHERDGLSAMKSLKLHGQFLCSPISLFSFFCQRAVTHT
jgi:hypothetical protein